MTKNKKGSIDKNVNDWDCHMLFGLMYVFLIMFMFFTFCFDVIKIFSIL